MLFRKIVAAILFCFVQSTSFAQNSVVPDEPFLKNLLTSNPQYFKTLLTYPNEYKIQIVYTQIDRDSLNQPSFTTYTYQLDNYYYYPASLVKLPTSLLALEKINQLKVPGLTPQSVMKTDSACKCQRRFPTSKTNYVTTLDRYIKEMLLVSENEPYNRVYEFLGQEYFNERLKQKGYSSAYIVSRFDFKCGYQDNKCTNPIYFYDSTGNKIYYQPPQITTKEYKNPKGIVKVGTAYLDAREKKVYAPKDLTYINYLSLWDVHTMVKAVIFPETAGKNSFDITPENRTMMLRYMGMYPRESSAPVYNTRLYFDRYKKYLLFGGNMEAIKGDSIRSFNIVGQSYGFSADCAYICDYSNGVEFILSATIYTNKDGVINDNRYEYTTVAMPFFKNIGQLIYQHELKRNKKCLPDLEEFRLKFKDE